jgi:hypothetical protein
MSHPLDSDSKFAILAEFWDFLKTRKIMVAVTYFLHHVIDEYAYYSDRG